MGSARTVLAWASLVLLASAANADTIIDNGGASGRFTARIIGQTVVVPLAKAIEAWRKHVAESGG